MNPYSTDCKCAEPVVKQMNQLSVGLVAGIIAGVFIGFTLAIVVSTMWGELVFRWGVNGN